MVCTENKIYCILSLAHYLQFHNLRGKKNSLVDAGEVDATPLKAA